MAALAGVLAAFVLAAAIDWMWELTIVGLVAVVALGMLVGLRDAPDGGREPRRRAALRRARGELRERALRTAAVRGCARRDHVHRGADARPGAPRAQPGRGEARRRRQRRVDAADDARSLQPWASSPYLQLALIEEQAGDLRPARTRYIKDALERDSLDWSTWLVAARIQTKAGLIVEGRRSLRRAEALNPTSQLFEDLRTQARDSSSR